MNEESEKQEFSSHYAAA